MISLSLGKFDKTISEDERPQLMGQESLVEFLSRLKIWRNLVRISVSVRRGSKGLDVCDFNPDKRRTRKRSSIRPAGHDPSPRGHHEPGECLMVEAVVR